MATASATDRPQHRPRRRRWVGGLIGAGTVLASCRPTATHVATTAETTGSARLPNEFVVGAAAPGRWAVAARVVVVVVGGLVLVAFRGVLPGLAPGGRVTGGGHHRQGDPTTTTAAAPVDLSTAEIPIRVEGSTTTTLPPDPGRAVITGRVLDPDRGEPVAGATVRAEWWVSTPPPRLEMTSGEDGTFRFEQLWGGRWRIRAFRVPDAPTVDKADFFLGADEVKSLVLHVRVVPEVAVTWSVAPNPPHLDEPANLAVLVAHQQVDNDGRLSYSRLGGVEVTLSPAEGWVAETPPTVPTGRDGVAHFRLRCLRPDPHPLSVSTAQRTVEIGLPGCRPRPPSTTTQVPEAPLPSTGGEGTSTPTSSGPVASTTTTTAPPPPGRFPVRARATRWPSPLTTTRTATIAPDDAEVFAAGVVGGGVAQGQARISALLIPQRVARDHELLVRHHPSVRTATVQNLSLPRQAASGQAFDGLGLHLRCLFVVSGCPRVTLSGGLEPCPLLPGRLSGLCSRLFSELAVDPGAFFSPRLTFPHLVNE